MQMTENITVASSPLLHRRLGRADHHGRGRGCPPSAFGGKTRRSRAGGPLRQPHRPAQARHRPRRGTRRLNPAFPLWGVCPLSGSARLTPGPPPFSSVNSTPARLSIPSIVAGVAASPAYRLPSIFMMVFRLNPVPSRGPAPSNSALPEPFLLMKLSQLIDLGYRTCARPHNQ